MYFPEMMPVTSKVIKQVGYNKRNLYVRFVDGNFWVYKDVPIEHFVNIMTAESPGSYLAKHIKKDFIAKKLFNNGEL